MVMIFARFVINVEVGDIIMIKILLLAIALGCSEMVIPARMAHVKAGWGSWYNLPGRETASGQIFDLNKHTCAMWRLPIGQRINLYNPRTKKWSYCWINDKGPNVEGRIIDVTPLVKKELKMRDLEWLQIYYDI